MAAATLAAPISASANCLEENTSLHQDVEVLLEVFRVNHVAATNATTITSQVIGLKSASIKPPTTALNPVAWLGPKLTVMRMRDMANKIWNPTNKKSIPRPITLTARMFYS